MTTIISNRTWLFSFFGLIMLIICTALFAVNTSHFKIHTDLLSLAVTADITLGIPLLYYFIVSRKLKVIPVTTLLVFLICTVIAGLILPGENQYYLDLIKGLLIVTELTLITYGIIMIRKLIMAFKQSALIRNDFLLNLHEALENTIGHFKFINFVISEISAIRYGLFFWKGEKEILPGKKYFTTHRKSGYTSIWGVLCFAIILETVGIHLLLWNWNSTVAIVMTILSIYTFVYLIADLVSIIKRPVVFYNNKLYFRVGIRWNAIIDPAQIISIDKIKNFNKQKDTLDCSLIGNPNMLLTFNQPVTLNGIFGIKRTTSKVVFNIDEDKEFTEELKHFR